jgi:ParB-like chromosome segregation protein Spo0J
MGKTKIDPKGMIKANGIPMAIMEVPLAKLTEHPDNPRRISAEKFAALKKSIQEMPEMLYKRPLIVVSHEDGYQVLGGNMRLKALRELGIENIPVMLADEFSKKQQREFIIKDNVAFGEWDWELLKQSWGEDGVNDWGLDLPDFERDIDYSLLDTQADEEESIDAVTKAVKIHFPIELYPAAVEELQWWKKAGVDIGPKIYALLTEARPKMN